MKNIKCNTPACRCSSMPEQDIWRRFFYKSVSKKLIWIDIPKCASTSIRDTLGFNDRKELALHLPEPDNALKENLDDYFKFAFVRNPFARIVSNWKMWTGQPHPRSQIESYKKPFVKGLENFSFREFLDLTERVNNHHWHRQYDFIKIPLDFIGKVENLQKDFDMVCDKIGIARAELPHMNKTKHKSYIEYYDDETREIVAEKYAKDIEYFGYTFGD